MHPRCPRCSSLKYCPIILGRRGLPAGRLAALGATLAFHRGLVTKLRLKTAERRAREAAVRTFVTRSGAAYAAPAKTASQAKNLPHWHRHRLEKMSCLSLVHYAVLRRLSHAAPAASIRRRPWVCSSHKARFPRLHRERLARGIHARGQKRLMDRTSKVCLMVRTARS